MKFFVVACVALAPLASGCIEYAPPYAHVTVSASAPMPSSSGGYAPQSVPDIPTVPGQRVDAETIRRTLDGNGTWQQDPTYGSIWIPYEESVGQGFIPYGTQGHWVLSDSGWYWQSELRFGWLTFHYGRWVMARESWAWVPGAMFAPAWVDWRVGDGYVGWAPLPPLGANYAAPYAFCSYGSLWMNDVWSHVVYGAGAASIYGVTQAVPPSYGIGGAVYAWGPAPTTVQGSTPPTLVPIASAWRGETNPRAGSPAGGMVGSSEGHGVGNPVVVAHSGATVPTAGPGFGTYAGNSATTVRDIHTSLPSPPVPSMGTPALTANAGRVPEAMAWTPAPASGTLPHAPGMAPVVANRQAYETPTVTVNRDVIGTGRYRTSDTVVIGSSVPSAPIRDTVSLGTSESNYGGSQYAAPSYPSGGYNAGGSSYGQPHYQPSYTPPPSVPSGYGEPHYAAPSYGGGGGGGYVAQPAPSYAAPSYGGGGGGGGGGYVAPAPSYAAPSYNGGGGYAAPHYAAPAPAYAAPSYGGGGGGYAAPHYSAPAPAYHPTNNAGGYRGFRR